MALTPNMQNKDCIDEQNAFINTILALHTGVNPGLVAL